LNGVFAAEFVEHHSNKRSKRDQGGGVHGQAILTRYDIRSAVCMTHRHQPFDWARHGHTLGEPRDGQRAALKATLDTPIGDLLVYNVHFELFCGLTDRIKVLNELFLDSESSDSPRLQLICGDFNTLAHSIARLSAKYCKDSYRFRSLGWTEPEFLQSKVLNVFSWDHEENPHFSDPELRSAVNPGFYDPWDPYADVTLISYRGLFQGKLDWILGKNVTFLSRSISNQDFKASDHMALCTEIEPAPQRFRPEKKILRRPPPGIFVCSHNEASIDTVLHFLAMAFLALTLACAVAAF
jgi:endonuclease/exonuclease/phosphatase family metal-dependent hydrolase